MGRNIAEMIFDQLLSYGIKHVFLVPGDDPCLHLAIENSVAPIIMRDERAAAFAAQIYGRIKGLGCFVTSHGPGMTNSITGLAAALLDKDPVVAIHSCLPINKHGINSHSHVSPEITHAVTKSFTVIDKVFGAKENVCEEIKKARGASYGPVSIHLPFDMSSVILEQECDLSQVDEAECEVQIIDTIEEKSVNGNIAVVVGGGVKRGKCEGLVNDFISKVKAYPFASMAGRGGTLCEDELFVSRHNIDHMCEKYNIDSIIALGLDDSEGLKINNQKRRVIDVSDEPAVLGVKEKYSGKIEHGLKKIIKYIGDNKKERSCVFREKSFHPIEVSAENSAHYPGYVVVDTGLFRHAWGSKFIPRFSTQLQVSNGISSIGWALGASIGLSVATNQKVLAVVGDGSLSMSSSELFSIMQYDLPVDILLVRDNSYGMIKRLEEEVLGSHTKLTNLCSLDYKRLANVFKFKHSIFKDSISMNDYTACNMGRRFYELRVDYSTYKFGHKL
ncbi:MAG: thiamine pyrophosphate-binding protein [Bacteroidetes bacterium]|nr:thiamine pyrophosphate-binding protein [Bacteroidota bacterium]